MKYSTQSLVLWLSLAACREVRGEPNLTHEDELDGARTVEGAKPIDASADASREPDAGTPEDARAAPPKDAALDAQSRDADPPSSEGSAPFEEDAATPGDAQLGPYKWYDAALPPPEGAWPVDPQVQQAPRDAGRDPGCVLSVLGNSSGVGASCLHNTRDQTCIYTRTCNEALALHGLDVPTPYYCTRPCRQHADCGDHATCCAVPGLEGKACILDGCRHACR